MEKRELQPRVINDVLVEAEGAGGTKRWQWIQPGKDQGSFQEKVKLELVLKEGIGINQVIDKRWSGE